MHPAPSLIAFTVLSGFGFGLMAWLGAGAGPAGGLRFALLALLALGTALAGLLASLLHLGNPQRAWRALSQWRSSWLSREGVAALAAVAAFAGFAGLRLLGIAGAGALGGLAALLALGTVFCTAMIYAALRTVPAWNRRETPALFLAFALAGPATLLGPAGRDGAGFLLTLAAFGLLLAALLRHWHGPGADLASRGLTTAAATGLGAGGAVRPFEPPQTGGGWLLREMVFRVGRRRARALRRLALGLGVAAPVLLLALSGHDLARALAFLLHLAGAAAARWLFFAGAEHVVAVYFPATSAVRSG